jgi:hypothetical protein
MSKKSFMLTAHESVSLSAEENRLIDALNAQVCIGLSSFKDIEQIMIYKSTFGHVIGNSDEQFFTIESLLETVAKKQSISFDVLKATAALGCKRSDAAILDLLAPKAGGLNA